MNTYSLNRYSPKSDVVLNVKLPKPAIRTGAFRLTQLLGKLFSFLFRKGLLIGVLNVTPGKLESLKKHPIEVVVYLDWHITSVT